MDWPAVTRQAYAAAAGAKTAADTYPAIQLIIKALGEKHTFFIDPDHARAQATGKSSGKAEPPPVLLPEGMRLANGIGVIRLYGFVGSPDAGKLYTQTAQAKITDMKVHGVCRFVLDLRENSGGNMYPMLNGVAGLLEPGILGTFENPQGKYSPWALTDGTVTVLPSQDTRPVAEAVRAALPVAVLLGPQTASSGEFTAMSFEGRAHTRFFGAPTAGYVTANSPVPLSDGAVIVMTDSWGHDRVGKKYVDRIEPDVNTGSGGAALDAAVNWLSAQPCPRHSARPRSPKRR
jgi:C-terminal processing protease CtpA/Prc